MTFNPAPALQCVEESADAFLACQPLVDRTSFNAAVIGMYLASYATLVFKHFVQLLLQVEAGDNRP